MTGVSIVTTTMATETEAAALADALVRGGLAACVQMSPIRSVYRWKGAVETTGECALWIKTRTDVVERVRDEILRRHAYEVPEILAWETTDGHEAYLAWVRESVATPPEQP